MEVGDAVGAAKAWNAAKAQSVAPAQPAAIVICEWMRNIGSLLEERISTAIRLQKFQQRGGGCLRSLLLKQMAAVERRALHMRGLFAPGGQHVIELSHHPLRSPEREQRRLDPPAGIGGVMLEIDGRGGAIILADGVDGSRQAVAAKIFPDERFAGHAGSAALPGKMAAQEEFRSRLDHAFGKRRGLDQEKPPEVTCGKSAIGAGVHRRRGCN